MNRRHMTGDHHGRTAGRATLLARAMDEILGTHTLHRGAGTAGLSTIWGTPRLHGPQHVSFG